MDPEDRLFGEIAIKLGFVERSSFRGLLRPMQQRPGELGAILLELGLLTPAQVEVVTGHQQRILRKRRATREVPEPNSGERAHEGSLDPAEPVPRHSVVPPPREEVVHRPLSTSWLEDDSAKNDAPFLHRVLEFAVRQGASDVHVHAGAPMQLRVQGKLVPLEGAKALPPADAEKMIAEILRPWQWQRLAEVGHIDFAYELPDVTRFRVNAYRQQRGLDIVLRVIPNQVPDLEQLGLPAELQRLTEYRTGLVLCTGPAGSGKSTTLAALLSVLIRSRKEHVITLEDPVEHVLPSGSSWVNQRQVPTHTESFGRALRAALREDPDVIAITELRDRETIGLSLSAAETGHLVLGTLNTNSAGQTISRIINAFPGAEQGHVRGMLSESLRAVVSQRLVPTADEAARVPALEILIGTTAVANLIRDNKTFQLPSVMQTGGSVGMVTLDNSLAALVARGTITKQQAVRFATAKERFL